MRWVGWMVMGAASISCIGPGPLAPGQSGDTWAELQTEHFTLVSDLAEDDAAKVIGSFEETYGLLGEALFGEAAVPSYPTRAIVFRSPQDLGEFVGEAIGGAYYSTLPNDLEPSSTLLAAGTLSPFARLTFAHELTHRFNHVALGAMPTWLEEGLAEYYSTIRMADGAAVVGEIDPRSMCTPDGLGDLVCYQYERLPGTRLPTASQLLAMSRQEFYASVAPESGNVTWDQKRKRAAHYGLARLLVHLLMHGEQDYSKQFREVMKTAPSTQKGAALSEVVRLVPPARLDADLKTFLQRRIPWRQHHARLPSAHGAQRRALDGAEVRLWWARLDSFQGKFADRARGRIREALELGSAEHPGAPSFWLGRFEQSRNQHAAAERAYRAAVKLEPHNPDYLYGLLDLYWSPQNGATWAEAAGSPPVRETVRALAPIARSPAQLSAVAAHRLYSNDVEAALATSQRACALGPDCWACFHNHAAALFASGQAQAALDAEQTALSRLAEDAPPRIVTLMQKSVDFYRAAARGAASAGKEPPGLLAP